MRLALAFSFLLFYFVALQMVIKACHGCIEKERMGLLDMKAQLVAQLGDFAESELASWVDDRTSNCCYWHRIECGANNNNISTTGFHVTELSLSVLTTSVDDLKMLNFSMFHPFQELVTLDLSGNFYSGWIHSEGLSSLKKLETLDLSYNGLNTSSILHSLNGLTLLRTLKLSANSMCDSLPAQGLQNLKSLEVLDLSENSLNGSIEGLCEMKDLRELGLNQNELSGEIPKCLSNLRNLQVLDLSQNQFRGNFPNFVTNLTSLAYLSLYGNHLEGPFSLSTLANHSNLRVLYISSQSPKAHVVTENKQWFPTFQLKSLILQSCNLNMGEGSAIPRFLLYQKDLQFIDLSHNKLVGAFPNWLIQNNSRLKAFRSGNNLFDGNLQLSSVRQHIFHLDISNNNIGGSLPKDIGTFLPGIAGLILSMNNFEGNIPPSIGKMQQLSSLDLSYNHFSGEVPEQLATSCIMLQILKLSNNFFQGNIPNFSVYINLKVLYIDNNNFTTTLEGVLANLNGQGLVILDISNNSISGVIPSSIGKLSSIKILLMAENQLKGEIPSVFSNLTGLESLDLSQNNLFGSISHFNLSPSLQFLYLQKNGFSGYIPSKLFENSYLVTLDLRDNNFAGSIPHWMDKLPNLRVLLLGGNNFRGHIPIQFCQLKQITILDLSRNKITGSIPSCFNSSTFGMAEDDSYGNAFEFRFGFSHIRRPYFLDMGSIINSSVSLFMTLNDDLERNVLENVEFRTKNNYYSYKGQILENMNGLDLSCNMLTGIIPSQIGNLQQIRALNLSHNYLSGFIPNTFSNLTQIESLDLSYNNLSGEIPSQLTQLYSLSIFNVSYNNLSGRPPSTGQFGNFDDENYRGNPGLCGPLLKHKCDSVAAPPPAESNNTGTKESAVDMVAFYWSFVASYVTILMGIIAVLCINVHWRMVWFYYIGKFVRRCFPTFPMY